MVYLRLFLQSQAPSYSLQDSFGISDSRAPMSTLKIGLAEFLPPGFRISTTSNDERASLFTAKLGYISSGARKKESEQ